MRIYSIFLFINLAVLFVFWGCKEKNEISKKEETRKKIEQLIKEHEQNENDLDYKALNDKGLTFYREKKYNKAVVFFTKAVIKSGEPQVPGVLFEWIYPPASYNLACTLSILYGNNQNKDLKKIIKYLGYALDVDYKNYWRKKADKDKDYDAIRDTIEYKQLMLRNDLRYATVNNNMKFIKGNIDKIKNINIIDSFGHSLLFYSIKENNFKLVDLYLSRGANIDKCFANNNSPLIYLLYTTSSHVYSKNYNKMIQYLITKGADINVVLKNDYPFESFEDYYAEVKGQKRQSYDQNSGITQGENLLNIILSSQLNKQLLQLLFEKNIDLDYRTITEPTQSVFVYVKKNSSSESSNDIEYRNFIIKLLKKHKDKRKAEKYINYIKNETE